MKKSLKSILYLTVIVLIIIVAVLTGIIIKNSNSAISKQEEGKAEQLTETSSDNAYVDMATHLSEVGNGSYTNFSFVESKTLYSGYRVASGSKTFTLDEGKYYIVAVNVYTGGDEPFIPVVVEPTLTIDNGTIEIISEEYVTTSIIDIYSGGATITVNYTGNSTSTIYYTQRVYVSIYKS